MSVDEPGGSFDDLQHAIDEADDGATIVVEGVCHGPVSIEGRANLTITGIEPATCPPDPSALGATVKGGSHVIKVTDSENIEIRFLNIIDGDEGLEFKVSANGLATCNCIAKNDDEGVELHGGQHHEIRQNLITRNADDGIVLKHETGDNTVVGNAIRQNGDDGIEVEAHSDGNVIADNVVEDNDEDGIDLDGTDRNRVTGNEVRANGHDPHQDSGIELADSDKNVVDGNSIHDNADGLHDKIRCQDGSDDNQGSNVTSHCD